MSLNVFKSGQKTIDAHKCVLISFSRVFNAMFASNRGFVESADGVVHVKGFEPEIVSLSQFIY